MKTKSALSYFGSDSQVAPRIAALLDGCTHVTIPFIGGGAILPYLTARGIVANDLNRYAINFYRHATGMHGRATQKKLFDRCDHTLSHPSEVTQAMDYLAPLYATSWQQAWGYWALCWVCRKGKGGCKHMGGLPSVRRRAIGGTNATRIQAAAVDLREWAKHFQRCEWECQCFSKLLPKVADDPECGVYCDAPWMGSGHAYEWTFKPEDHVALAEQLERFTATRIVVRYGDCKTIRDLYSGPRWRITEAAARTQANANAREIWITNFDAKEI